MPQQWCVTLWQFGFSSNHGDSSTKNPNIEIRNPKQYQNCNFQNAHQTMAAPDLLLFWSFELESLDFVSNFEFRISDFRVSGSWVK